MIPYGGRKHKTLKAPRYGRCGVCGKYVEIELKNDRVENKEYEIMRVVLKEYGE